MVTGTVLGVASTGLSKIPNSTVSLYQAGAGPNSPAAFIGSAVTDINGVFSVSGAPPSGTEPFYAVAIGGSIGGGTSIALMVMIGPITIPPVTVTIDELTTVASVYAVRQFFASEADIRDTTAPELVNASANVGNFVNISTGSSTGTTITNSNNSPNKLNELANALANCVELTTSTACTSLFSAADLPSTPSDTLQAIINIANNPVSNVATIFNLGATGPFIPVFLSAPSDFSLPVTFTLSGLLSPSHIGIDGHDLVWAVDNRGNVNAIDNTGVSLFSSALTNASIVTPTGLAIDPSNNVWITSLGSTAGNVVKFDNSTNPPTQTVFAPAQINQPEGLAIDSSGDIWITNFANNTLSELNSAGTPVTGSPFLNNGLSSPEGIAIDSGGNAWVADFAAPSGPSGPSGPTTFNISEFTAAGAAAANSPFTSPASEPEGVAIDSSNNVWVSNQNVSISSSSPPNLTFIDTSILPFSLTTVGASANLTSIDLVAADGVGNVWVPDFGSQSGLLEFNSAGAELSPAFGYSPNIIAIPAGIAIDGAGDVWLSDEGGTVTEFVGLTRGVTTPLIGAPAPP
ncbi:MAG TPA: hypothetical protein VNF29_08935 [Candidatus Binataceae bacterium]|nr:hypothetical protein [Candidatus Binataceae bacterium]